MIENQQIINIMKPKNNIIKSYSLPKTMLFVHHGSGF